MSDLLVKEFTGKSRRNDLFSDAEIAEMLVQCAAEDKAFRSFFDGLKKTLLEGTKAHIQAHSTLCSIVYSYASPGSGRLQAMRREIDLLGKIQPKILGSFQDGRHEVKGLVLEREAIENALKAALQLDDLALPVDGYEPENVIDLQQQFSARVDAVMLGLMTMAARYELPIHLSGTGHNRVMMEAVQRLKSNHGYHTQCIAVVASLDKKLKRASGVMHARLHRFNDLGAAQEAITQMDASFQHEIADHLAFADDYKIILAEDKDFRVVATRIDGQVSVYDADIASLLHLDLSALPHDESVAIFDLGR